MQTITITITIQTPEGSSVSVSQGQDKPFVQREAPPQPGGYCPIHDVGWQLVPAGVSKKTGKPYNAFWACPERGCNEKPAREPAMTEIGQRDNLPF